MVHTATFGPGADDDSGDDPAEVEAAITTAGIAGWDASQPNISMARATGISVPLPTTQDLPAEEEASLSEDEIAYREVVRDCNIALNARGTLRTPVAPTPHESCTLRPSTGAVTLSCKACRPSSDPNRYRLI